jgi:hypothetical protein
VYSSNFSHGTRTRKNALSETPLTRFHVSVACLMAIMIPLALRLAALQVAAPLRANIVFDVGIAAPLTATYARSVEEMKAREAKISPLAKRRLAKATERIVQLYDASGG